ncbi:LMBR1-like membrane protein [Lineolata rhizophorae]|uniref:LMBR1-like membrane protein n=1 Tax=Lineolata rhizophorae TaxID=578093 RepID=A0A6A6NW47_9PEZI|nr:LMBR1-like membrane protein [Lineolata rhizophorae]
MTASAGSAVFFVAALLAICAFVLLLLRHYLPLRPTPAYLLLPVFLALALPASIILLVPIDLATVFTQDDTAGSPKGIWLPPRVVLVAWRITYWLTFALTWIILPLVGEYVDAGHRSPRSRFMYALNANLRYQAIVLGLAIAAGVYVFLTSGVSFASLKALVMALAYAWGLVLAIALMGHGLVALPREMFKQASTSGRLRRAQARAPRVHEKLLDAEDELAEVEDQVRVLSGRKRGTALDFQDWIDELAEGAGVHEAPSAAARGTTNTTAPAVITERYLAELTRRLHRAKHKRARFADEWECLVDMAVEAQAILDAAGSQRLEFSPRPDNSSLKGSHPLSWQSYVSKTWRKASKAWLTPRTRYYLHANILPSISVFVAILAAVASVFLVETEMLRPFSVQQGALIPLTVRMFAPRTEAFDFSKQFVSAFWLCYAVACTLYSVSFVRVWRGRALVRRGTHPESAAWYAALAARLAVPLAYHVGSMLTQSDGAWDRTVFHDFLGRMIDFTPLGEGFSRWFPVFVLVPMMRTTRTEGRAMHLGLAGGEKVEA